MLNNNYRRSSWIIISYVIAISLASCDHYSVNYSLPHGYILSSLDGDGAGLTIWAPAGGDAVVPTYWEEGALIEISRLAIVGDLVIGEVWNRKTDELYELFVLNTADGKLVESRSESEWVGELAKVGIVHPPALRNGTDFR
jgi:hypothetical protein